MGVTYGSFVHPMFSFLACPPIFSVLLDLCACRFTPADAKCLLWPGNGRCPSFKLTNRNCSKAWPPWSKRTPICRCACQGCYFRARCCLQPSLENQIRSRPMPIVSMNVHFLASCHFRWLFCWRSLCGKGRIVISTACIVFLYIFQVLTDSGPN